MINVISHTTKPISFIGYCAGACQNANINDEKANFKRGVECINSDHGRAMEYADVVVEISGYSARMIRELYTHIVGVSRLQESTRYVDCNKFDYFTPQSIKNSEEGDLIYFETMKKISESYKALSDLGLPREDIANILPLGMNTKICLKINVRAIMTMCEKRLCNRAYHEYRSFMNELKETLSDLDEEWKLLCDKIFLPSCDKTGFCVEKHSCGKHFKRLSLITSDDISKYLGEFDR